MSQEQAHRRLIEALSQRGITDSRVLSAMSDVPRDCFVSAELRSRAYDDHALPIEAAQTISQPYMVALMTQELRLAGDETVLEIGTGSGYQAAVLAKLCRRVVTIERIPELSRKARSILDGLGFTTIEFHIGDGTLGWSAGAPYDGVIVTAGAPDVPAELYRQLRLDGRLVIPIGFENPQMLRTIVKRETAPETTDVCGCSFVPLIGEGGWPASEE
jgi:protein-L-isoaspartate(D-aspartate) O-methyltransferase